MFPKWKSVVCGGDTNRAENMGMYKFIDFRERMASVNSRSLVYVNCEKDNQIPTNKKLCIPALNNLEALLTDDLDYVNKVSTTERLFRILEQRSEIFGGAFGNCGKKAIR